METGGGRERERTRTGVREKGTVRPVKAPVYIRPGPGHRRPSKLVNMSTKCAKRATCRPNVLREQPVDKMCYASNMSMQPAKENKFLTF